MNDAVVKFYSGQHGGDLAYFQGNQYGSGWLRTLGRIAFPILKSLVGVATNTAEDMVMRDKKLGEAISSNVLKRKHTIYDKKHKQVQRRRM